MNNIEIKDKIAVVFHGLVGGVNGNNGQGKSSDISICAKTIKNSIISKYDCDIFMHSWSVDKEEELKSLYNPIDSLFQPQEYFDFTEEQVKNLYQYSDDAMKYRTTSRYTSLERAMKLKQNYELNNNFKYKWVLILRYDLIIFKELDLSICENDNMYICSHWAWLGEDMIKYGCAHDIIFLSNSEIMDEYSNLAKDILINKYSTINAHHLAYRKLMDIFNNDINRIGYIFKRIKDIEPYRQVINPIRGNDGSWENGGSEIKQRFENLIKNN